MNRARAVVRLIDNLNERIGRTVAWLALIMVLVQMIVVVMRYVDLDTWETRQATLREHREAMIVADALDNCHLADAVFAYTELKGVPPVMTFLETLASGTPLSSVYLPLKWPRPWAST